MNSASVPSGVRLLHTLAGLLDLRVAVVLLACILLMVSPLQSGSFARFDQLLFTLAKALRQDNPETAGYVRIDLSDSDMQALLDDPLGTAPLMQFLDAQQQSFIRATAWVLPRGLVRNRAFQDFLLQHSRDFSVETEAGKALNEMTARTRVWVNVLANDHNVFVSPQPAFPAAGNVLSRLLSVNGNPLQRTHMAVVPYRQLADVRKTGLDSGQLPLSGADEIARALLWYADNVLQPDALLATFLRQQGLAGQTLTIVPDGIQAGDRLIRVSASGLVYPFYGTRNGEQPDVRHYALRQLVALSQQDIRRLLHEKTVVMGLEHNADADNLLYGLLSLERNAYAIIPLWYGLAHWAVILVVLLSAMLVQWLRPQWSLMLLAVLLVSLVFTQQVFLLLHQLWLPCALWVCYLLAAYGLMFAWRLRRHFYPVQALSLLDFSYGDGVAARTVEKKTPAPAMANTRAPVRGVRDIAAFDAQTLVDDAGARPPQRSAGGRRQQLGRYRLERELGRGAMGIVYLGFDPKISRQVAIKTLNYDQVSREELAKVKERFFREAEAAGRLRHPNIVTIYDAGEDSDLAYIAMDYVAGESLAAHIHQVTLLDVEMVYWIVAQVADALDYAHTQGIIHRDIKPSNILFDANRHEVKVADFGIARIMDGSATRTRTGDILGSPLYMSPEQLRGEKISGRSDVFSLGVTMYQLLTGELPFKGDNLANLSLQIVQGKYRPIDEVRPDLPESARKIINKALQKNPDNRFASAGEMMLQLQRALDKDFR